MFGAPALVPANPLPFHVPHDQDHVTTTTTTADPTTFYMSQWIQLCWFICCAQVQVSNSGRRKLRAPARKAFGKPLEYGYSYVVYFGFVCCPTWLDYRRLKSKSYRQQIKMVVCTYFYYRWRCVRINGYGVMCCCDCLCISSFGYNQETPMGKYICQPICDSMTVV